MAPHDEEQWTLSVQHTDGDIDRHVQVFAGFCQARRVMWRTERDSVTSKDPMA